MNTEIKVIIERIKMVSSGEPWFGKGMYTLLDEVNTKHAHTRPCNAEHTPADLLYHIITWADFTLQRIKKVPVGDLTAAEAMDWRIINPEIHTWKKGVASFKKIQKRIIAMLLKKEDTFLREKVNSRTYDFRFLINGMIEHNIYHLGQIAYINKLLK
jgi:DinB superfamily